MQIVGAALATGAVGLGCAVFLHGLWNTIDWMSWKLHCLAMRGRKIEAQQTALMGKRWMGEI